MFFHPVEEYYECQYDKMENTGIHKIKGKIKEHLNLQNVQNSHFMTNVQERATTMFSRNPPTI